MMITVTITLCAYLAIISHITKLHPPTDHQWDQCCSGEGQCLPARGGSTGEACGAGQVCIPAEPAALGGHHHCCGPGGPQGQEGSQWCTAAGGCKVSLSSSNAEHLDFITLGEHVIITLFSSAEISDCGGLAEWEICSSRECKDEGWGAQDQCQQTCLWGSGKAKFIER